MDADPTSAQERQLELKILGGTQEKKTLLLSKCAWQGTELVGNQN